MISIENISLSFGGFDLFRNISFVVNPGECIGLIGKNGAGKSTLLKIINGEQAPNSGHIAIQNEVEIGYLPQQMVCEDNTTIYEETRSGFEELISLEQKIEHLTQQINKREDYESKEYLDLITELSDANERYNLLEGGKMEERIIRCLEGLGFSQHDFHRKTSELSGGWRMRIEIAKLLLKKPPVLLLDEPTNHLDIESIQWLEIFLKTYQGAIILISHDRAFLDNVTNRTIEISLGRIYDYNVSYSKYVEQRKERIEQQLAAYRNQQKMIEDTERFIEKFRYKATKAVQVQSRIKQLDKLERIEVDEEDVSAIHIKFPEAPHSGKIIAEIEGLSKNYGKISVLRNIAMFIEKGEKMAFVGKNGEGKTTLSKIIVGDLDYKGHLRLGDHVKIGYFAQNQDEIMDNEKTVFQTIDEIAVGDIRTRIRDILGAFLFRGDDIDKKVKVLSGGERSRLALAKLLLQPCNLLVLDEPTNHLDMRSKDILKQALKQYNGTLIVVSHDREFLDGLVNKVYEFRDKEIREHIGGIYDFLYRKKIDSLNELESRDKRSVNEKRNPAKNKEKFLEKKEHDKRTRKIKNKIVNSEKTIEELENKINDLDEILASPQNNQQDDSIYVNYNKLKKQLEEELEKWELYNKELEHVSNERNL